MNMKSFGFCSRWLFSLAVATALFGAANHARAITFTVSPADGTFNVSPTAPVVFTFSEEMDPSSAVVTFMGAMGFPPPTFPVNIVWSGGNKVMTCTPKSPFPATSFVVWQIEILWNAAGDDFIEGEGGGFMTGTGGGGGTGSGTNKITSFSAGKIYNYVQTSAAAPVLDTENPPYMFGANTILASNRTANAITITLPTGSVSNLWQNPFLPEIYAMGDYLTSATAFEAKYPQGTYTFRVEAVASNQTVAISLPTSMTQPNAPHIGNYSAAQAVNASQPFTLTWAPFTGGTANDFIWVEVQGEWESPDPFTVGALNGTATSVTIPAGKLHVNSNYTASVGFYRATFTTNSSYTAAGYRATVTEFSLVTVGGGASLPVISNVSRVNNVFGFDVSTTQNQRLTVVYSSNPGLPLAQWPILLTTNAPAAKIRINDTRPNQVGPIFYRVRNGS
jgi:hypothetical protein